MLSKKKSANRKLARSKVAKRSVRAPEFTLGLPGERGSSNGTRYEYQRIKNPETAEEREKMLAKREALTLRAFRMAYENHHPRKPS